jgi:hypothetical protein
MENLDEKTMQLIESLKQSISNATERLNSIDLQKALDDHQKMEDLKEKMGVK